MAYREGTYALNPLTPGPPGREGSGSYSPSTCSYLEAFQVVDVDCPVPTDSGQPVSVCARRQQVNSLRGPCGNTLTSCNGCSGLQGAPDPPPGNIQTHISPAHLCTPLPNLCQATRVAQTQGRGCQGRMTPTLQGRKGGTCSALHTPLHPWQGGDMEPRDPPAPPQHPQLPTSPNLRAAEMCAGVCSPLAPAAGGRGQSLEQRQRRG